MPSLTQRHPVWQWIIWLCLAITLLLGSAIGSAWWLASRPAEPVTKEALIASRQRAMQWLHAHEDRVLADGNTALWWMLQDAGRRSGEIDLQNLTRKALAIHFSGSNQMEPWRRMLEPRAQINAHAQGLAKLEDYQRFFHHSLTCQPLSLKEGDTSQFLVRDMCAPMFLKVTLADPVCTTHQLFGLVFIRQTGCTGVPPLDGLENELLNDVRLQLTFDPLVRDPHIQRLLMLALHGRSDEIRPIWLQRMLQAQESDGGWLGRSYIPELPEWLQPHYLRDLFVKKRSNNGEHPSDGFDFHATAQAILLLTILTQSN